MFDFCGRPWRAYWYAETRLAAHPIIRGLRLLQRKNLVHRPDVIELAEQKRVLGIGRCPRIPTSHRSALAEEIERVDGQRMQGVADQLVRDMRGGMAMPAYPYVVVIPFFKVPVAVRRKCMR